VRTPEHGTDEDVQHEKQDERPTPRDAEELVVAQTATGYWIVKRGEVALAGAMTRGAAERERERIVCLAGRSVRRTLVGV
jgi:hypothetical protein